MPLLLPLVGRAGGTARASLLRLTSKGVLPERAESVFCSFLSRRGSARTLAGGPGQRAGEEAAAQWAVGDHADAKAPRGRKHVVFDFPPPQRPFRLQCGLTEMLAMSIAYDTVDVCRFG